MPATLRDLFYCRYDPMEAAEPNRPEYNAIYEELEQVEGELRKALGEEGRAVFRAGGAAPEHVLRGLLRRGLPPGPCPPPRRAMQSSGLTQPV